MIERAYLEIGNICNLSCSFCPKTSRPPYQITVEEFSDTVKKLKGKVGYLYLHVMGEPLLHPHLDEFLRILEADSLPVCITTNGTLLSSSAELLLSHAKVLHKVSVSIHSLEGNGKESLMREYIAAVADFAKRASEAGIYTVMRLWNADSEEKQGKNASNGEVLELLKREFLGEWQERRCGYRMVKNVFLEYAEIFTWPTESHASARECGRCHGLLDQIAILADGTVVPCCLDSEGEISLGNIRTSTLDEILASPRAALMKNGLLSGRFTEELCKRCSYANRFSK